MEPKTKLVCQKFLLKRPKGIIYFQYSFHLLLNICRSSVVLLDLNLVYLSQLCSIVGGIVNLYHGGLASGLLHFTFWSTTMLSSLLLTVYLCKIDATFDPSTLWRLVGFLVGQHNQSLRVNLTLIHRSFRMWRCGAFSTSLLPSSAL